MPSRDGHLVDQGTAEDEGNDVGEPKNQEGSRFHPPWRSRQMSAHEMAEGEAPEDETQGRQHRGGEGVGEVTQSHELPGEIKDEDRPDPEVDIVPPVVERGVMETEARILPRLVGVGHLEHLPPRLDQEVELPVAEGLCEAVVEAVLPLRLTDGKGVPARGRPEIEGDHEEGGDGERCVGEAPAHGDGRRRTRGIWWDIILRCLTWNSAGPRGQWGCLGARAPP